MTPGKAIGLPTDSKVVPFTEQFGHLIKRPGEGERKPTRPEPAGVGEVPGESAQREGEAIPIERAPQAYSVPRLSGGEGAPFCSPDLENQVRDILSAKKEEWEFEAARALKCHFPGSLVKALEWLAENPAYSELEPGLVEAHWDEILFEKDPLQMALDNAPSDYSHPALVLTAGDTLMRKIAGAAFALQNSWNGRPFPLALEAVAKRLKPSVAPKTVSVYIRKLCTVGWLIAEKDKEGKFKRDIFERKLYTCPAAQKERQKVNKKGR